ncbi:MAG: response regulator [Deltaproteobacteria bacterium]|nr:response regulator [Deltaproteobacteria bacterium]
MHKSKNTTAPLAQNLAALVNSHPDGMIIIDQDKTILYANPSALSFFSKTPDQLEGTTFTHPYDINKTTPIKITGSENQTMFGDIKAAGIRWQNKPAVLIALRDVSETKIINTLKQDIHEDEKLNRLKNDFIGTVSHELRTPLSIIQAAINNLSNEKMMGPMTSLQLQTTRVIHRAASRLSLLINDLLDLSRLESGRALIRKKRINLNELLIEIVQGFQTQAKEKNLTLKSETTTSLPDVYFDSNMLAQVFHNLVSNAIRFARSQITIRISQITAAQQHGLMQVDIIDDGPGIPVENQKNLFKKFSQINRLQGGEGYKGTGLGLVICKQILSHHQCKIGVESGEGTGACFYFTLPVYDPTTEFEDQLINSVTEAKNEKTNLCLMAVFIDNAGMIRETAGEEAFFQTINQLKDDIRKKILRQTDKIFLSPKNGQIIIHVKDDETGALSVKKRIMEHVRHQDHPDRQDIPRPEVSIGTAVFPNDATEPHMLLDIAYKKSQKKKVLFIDDEENLLETISAFCKSRDFIVETALDGETGIHLAKTFSPDVIVLDIMMPVMDGWTVCEILRKDPDTSHIPIIFLTALVASDLKEKAAQYKTKLVLKPFEYDEFLDLLIKQSGKKV